MIAFTSLSYSTGPGRVWVWAPDRAGISIEGDNVDDWFAKHSPRAILPEDWTGHGAAEVRAFLRDVPEVPND